MIHQRLISFNYAADTISYTISMFAMYPDSPIIYTVSFQAF